MTKYVDTNVSRRCFSRNNRVCICLSIFAMSLGSLFPGHVFAQDEVEGIWAKVCSPVFVYYVNLSTGERRDTEEGPLPHEPNSACHVTCVRRQGDDLAEA